jgi:hypothetical protein
MTARVWVMIGLISLVMHGAAREAAACRCLPSGPPCQAAWDADAIFTGTVRAVDHVTETVGSGVRVVDTIVRFEIQQPILNMSEGSVELVNEGMSTCSYRFNEGQRYLVYARKREDGRLMAGICSRTRPLAEAAEDLRFLSALPKSGAGARVYGRVTESIQHPAEEHGVDYGPLEHITVTVRGATFSRDVLTDKDGRYELTGVPPGAVTVSIVPPFGSHGYGEHTAMVKDLRACVAADFTVEPRATAHGIVLNEAGRPVAGILVEAIAEELAGHQPKAIHTPAKTDEHGRFAFDRLPPGAYVFGIDITRRVYPPSSGRQAYLPGTAVAREATVFNLKAGDKTDVGVMRLPTR